MLTHVPALQPTGRHMLVGLKKKYGDKVAIISVLTLPNTYTEAEKFAARHGITWPIVFDSGQMITSYLEVMPAEAAGSIPALCL